MLKRLCLALAGLFAFVSIASGAGTVPGFSLTPQFDLTGKVAPGCKLYIIQAGTTSTPQNGYQDTGLTQVLPNPLTCDAGGRLPQWFVADGLVKLRLTTSTGTQIFVGDNLLVVGPSSGGGGGGGTVDPTTILATGDVKYRLEDTIIDGWVRLNGRTIGNAVSGATERANADTQALYVYIWNTYSSQTGNFICPVVGGIGATPLADYNAGKPITLLDMRGRALFGLDTMGNSAAGTLSGVAFQAGSATQAGSSGGANSTTLVTANLPPYTPIGTIGTVTVTSATSDILRNPSFVQTGSGSPGFGVGSGTPGGFQITSSGAGPTFTGSPQGGSSTAFPSAPRFVLGTVYWKL
jgi:hypothetical protein